MGKDWDKAVVPMETWKECYRILKQGKLAFIMCSPRQDVLSRMIVNLQDAGFRTNYTSIYWTFASGFPKAANVSKLIDKKNGRTESEYKQLADYLKQSRLKQGKTMKEIASVFPSKTGGITGCVWNWENAENTPTQKQYDILKDKLGLDSRFDDLIEREEAEREIVATKQKARSEGANYAMPTMGAKTKYIDINITKPATEEAKKMEGAYVGFQPKPAVEVILVVSKGKTLTWLDDCRIPYQNDKDVYYGHHNTEDHEALGDGSMFKMGGINRGLEEQNEKGRFPANLICQDDILNDGRITKSHFTDSAMVDIRGNNYCNSKERLPDSNTIRGGNDEGSYSRYFSLDQWWAKTFPFLVVAKASKQEKGEFNSHPTVKSLKLMSYLITMGSREGDLVLDPFCGSGTTLLAAHQLHRKYLGIELNPEYAQIIKKRILEVQAQLKLELWNEVPKA